MSDSLRASVDRLKQSTSKLNKITDEAAQVIQAVEAFLAKECSVGINVFVMVSEEADEHGPPWFTHLGYERYQGKFRVTVSVGIDSEDSTTKPWSEWDRATKLETVKKLPALLEKIASVVDLHVSAAQEATGSVAEVLNSLERKGGK